MSLLLPSEVRPLAMGNRDHVDLQELAARFLAGDLDPEENARFLREARAPGPLRQALADALADLGIEELREGLGGEDS